MGTLYCVATPIGNLEDITFRAVSVLKMVDFIACEDTRVTQRLLKKYEISTPTTSYHQHSSTKKIDQLISQLLDGKSIAIVSDAGTPGISDPGNVLITAAIAHSIPVIPIPGASAVITALQAAGVPTHQFTYLGFIPHKKGRQTMLNYIMEQDTTIVVYESTHRLLKTLETLQACSRKIVVARELTKIHEEFVRGTAAEVYAVFQERPTIKGECVIIIHS